jgi:phage head maturation protease
MILVERKKTRLEPIQLPFCVQHNTVFLSSSRRSAIMEAFLQLLSLLLLPYHCQTRPGARIWGRVGDQPKAANEAAAAAFLAASPNVFELTSASPPAAVTLKDGRYVWGAVDVKAEATELEDFETLFPVSAVSAAAIVSASTEASPSEAVPMKDGRYVWGEFDLDAEAPVAKVEDFETLFQVSAVSAAALVSASADVIELTSASPPAAVTLKDGRYAWGAVDVEAEAPVANVEDFETLFSVSAVSAAALVSASSDVIELTPASPPAAVTMEDGRWSWGAVARH